MAGSQTGVIVTSKEPGLFLLAGEVDRLKRILAEAPGPTNQDQTKYEMLQGPHGTKLHWTSYPDTNWEKLLRDVKPLMGPVLLRMGLHCYALKDTEDRLLIWRQIRVPPPGNILRMSLFDTTSLQPIGRRSKRRLGDPIIYESGLLAEVDLPATWEAGLQTLAFPDAMRGIPELLVLVHAIQRWKPGLPKAAWKTQRRTIIYVVRPSRSEVEAFPLEWARSVEGRFHWIARVARDPTSDRIVGDGAGVGLFLLDNHANFLGWIRRTKPKA